MVAARDLIVEQGWSSASNRAIAARAEVNLALISYHFGGKKKLLVAMLDRAVAEITEQYAPMHEADDLPAFVGAALRASTALASDPNSRVIAAAMLEAVHDRELAPAVKRNLRDLRAFVRAVVERCVVSEDQISGLVTLIAATLDGLILHLILDPETDVQGAGTAIEDALDSLLRP